jgi:hypothetical protein
MQARLAAEAGLHPKGVVHWERLPGEVPTNGADETSVEPSLSSERFFQRHNGASAK